MALDHEHHVGGDAELVLLEKAAQGLHLVAVRRHVVRDVVRHDHRHPGDRGIGLDPGVKIEAGRRDREQRRGPQRELDRGGDALPAAEAPPRGAQLPAEMNSRARDPAWVRDLPSPQPGAPATAGTWRHFPCNPPRMRPRAPDCLLFFISKRLLPAVRQMIGVM